MTFTQDFVKGKSYHAWLPYKKMTDGTISQAFHLENSQGMESLILQTARQELTQGIQTLLGKVQDTTISIPLILGTISDAKLIKGQLDEGELLQALQKDGYLIQSVGNGEEKKIYLIGNSDKGTLYATFHFLRLLQMGENLENIKIVENPRNEIRMINQWDNMDGSIERGYSGDSIFYENNKFTKNLDRVRDYARLLASVGINSISINNVNVFEVETKLITSEFLPDVAKVADIFRLYGITTFLSINYASPIEIGGLETADPLDEEVKHWWNEKVEEIYQYIPDFGGFVVKADSEHRPGPFTYGRNHVDGANVLAEALQPYGGLVMWRCFVYNCLQDWRDRSTDRARAAYDHFIEHDGKFLPNVILQVKNGPMDFQVREPISPLFGAMEQTNQVLEVQIAQEYTGQQIDLCYLIPQWKEVLDFDTYAKGKGSEVKKIVDGSLFQNKHSGIVAVSNIGNDNNWTGHNLAQANLYGFGRLIWNPELSSEEITKEWVQLTFGHDSQVVDTVMEMLLSSWRIYENYTSPLGIGWMINPNHHYGPNVDGYEYSVWGTYHFADRDGIGVDRTVKSGTGYAGQYFSPNSDMYESLETCPDELLLFFHHVPYTHKLKSGETVIQHIYNTHFEGYDQAVGLKEKWSTLKGKVDSEVFNNVQLRLDRQIANAREWKDQVNTYFFRKSGIPDELGRKIY